MRSVWTGTILAAAFMALGAAAAQAGGPPVALFPGPLVANSFPSPEYIPAPVAPTQTTPGAPAIAPVAPLPPVVIYSAPPIAIPLPQGGKR